MPEKAAPGALIDEAVAAQLDLQDVVRAAGGVVYRPRPGSTPEVALVHRPAYGDWSLPKGKLKAGERLETGALREVEEETGMTCLIQGCLGITRYIDRRGRDKVVWYWLMRAVSGSFVPIAEVDAVRWLEVAAAVRELTYSHDREILRRAALV
jgi:8-oxo-dGTP diphosphatase